MRIVRAVSAPAAAIIGLLSAAPAHAIPAFARKYETSCLTCHTIYPKLNPSVGVAGAFVLAVGARLAETEGRRAPTPGGAG